MSEEFDGQEEVDVISLLASQSQNEQDDDYEDDDDAIPDDIEGLRKALEREREIKRKRNKSLKMAKQAQHRTQAEYDALVERLEAIENRTSSAANNDGAAKLEQEAQEWRDRVEDDPTKAVEYTDWKFSMFEDRLARFIQTELGKVSGMVNELQQKTDPERQKYADQIAALRQAGLDLDDASLLNVAKTLSGAKVKAPRGSVGGQRPAKQEQSRETLSEDDLAKIRAAVRAGM